MNKKQEKPKLERYEGILRDKKTIFFNNIIGGIGWGIGAVLGGTIIVGLIIFILNQITDWPFVGDMVKGLIELAEIGQEAGV